MENDGRGEPGEVLQSRGESTGSGRPDSTAAAGAAAEGGDHLLLRFLAQLSRFGLAAGGDPLLKPARPSAT